MCTTRHLLNSGCLFKASNLQLPRMEAMPLPWGSRNGTNKGVHASCRNASQACHCCKRHVNSHASTQHTPTLIQPSTRPTTAWIHLPVVAKSSLGRSCCVTRRVPSHRCPSHLALRSKNLLLLCMRTCTAACMNWKCTPGLASSYTTSHL